MLKVFGNSLKRFLFLYIYILKKVIRQISDVLCEFFVIVQHNLRTLQESEMKIDCGKFFTSFLWTNCHSGMLNYALNVLNIFIITIYIFDILHLFHYTYSYVYYVFMAPFLNYPWILIFGQTITCYFINQSRCI